MTSMTYWLPANSVMIALSYLFVGRLVLNIRSMRSVMMNPPTTLLVAATMAITPSTVANVLFFSPTRTIAPTTAMASSALVSDMSGVCSKGETWRITSNPMNAASMKTKSASIRLEPIAPPSSRFSVLGFSVTGVRQRRHLEKFAHACVHYFSAVRDHGLANDLVLQVQLQLAVLHHIKKKCCDVSGVHLAGMVRNAAGEVDVADDGDAVHDHRFSGPCQFAVAPALRGEVNDDRARSHSFDHIRGDQHRRLLARN